jgi:Tic22-like family
MLFSHGCHVAVCKSFASLVSSLTHNRFMVSLCRHVDRSDATTAESSSSSSEKYPAMSRQEIEDWLEHVPVFAVTDTNGAGVVLKPENDSSVFYFFLNPMQANATLHQLLGSNTEMDLKVSAFSLGKIWFNLLHSETNATVQLAPPPGGETEGVPVVETSGVEYRLVPDTRDLLGARMLLTMTPEDGEKLKDSGGMTPELAQAAIAKAMTESPKFKATYNEIPVFTIAQMRMQKQAESEDASSTPVTLLPMYFSLQNMIGTWQQFMSQAPADLKGVEPAINLMSLHDLVGLMGKESEIDWRHVVLVPPTTSGTAAASSSTDSTVSAVDPMASMGGATLGDDASSDEV